MGTAAAVGTQPGKGSLGNKTAPPGTVPGTTNKGWTQFAISMQGRGMHALRIHPAPGGILIVGPLQGNSVEGPQLMDKLANHLLRGEADLRSGYQPPLPITILRDPNPDGRARKMIYNLHGIDLDRNFPTSDWKKVSTYDRWESGRQAGSEGETKAILKLMEQVQPRWVVTLRYYQGTPSIGYAGPSQPLAQAISQEIREPALALDRAVPSGAFSTYVGTERRLAFLEFRFRQEGTTEEHWNTFHLGMDRLLASLQSDPPAITAAKPAQPSTGALSKTPSVQNNTQGQSASGLGENFQDEYQDRGTLSDRGSRSTSALPSQNDTPGSASGEEAILADDGYPLTPVTTSRSLKRRTRGSRTRPSSQDDQPSEEIEEKEEKVLATPKENTSPNAGSTQGFVPKFRRGGLRKGQRPKPIPYPPVDGSGNTLNGP